MENKNTVIALVLMLAVWIAFSFLNPPQPTAPPPSEPARQETSETRKEPVIAEAAPVKLTPSVVMAAERRDLVVETDKFRAVFTNVGARLKSMELKGYTVEADPASGPVSLIDAGPDRMASLRTTGTDGFGIDADSLYNVSTEDDLLRLAGGESRQIVFTTTTAAGMTVEKIYTFAGDRYDFDLQVRLTNTTSAPASGSVLLSLVQPWDESKAGNGMMMMDEFVGPATLVGDELMTDDIEDLAEGAITYGRDAVWTAFEDKYFISAAIPLEGAAEKVRIDRGDDTVENALQSPYSSLAPGESTAFDYLLYFGPRDLDILKEVDHQLAEAVDFGFFSIIAQPLFYVLKFFYSFVGNYGVAIILLTVIIKILFWPLTQKSYASMKAMQKLQPQMQKVREKYKNDRERLNREIMELYKSNRVNPMGGCLPMLVQIPVFFALYKVLLGDIALRHAPFALWITDLSAKDPYYVTPIIMGGTMFLQQKLTPTTMDPTQAKMFMIMPVVFTFMFLNFPSGLVIYWLVNNLLTIVQQFLIHRKP